jgi:hypothetical protein
MPVDNAIDGRSALDAVGRELHSFARSCRKPCARRYNGSGISWSGGRAFGEFEAGSEIELARSERRKLRDLNNDARHPEIWHSVACEGSAKRFLAEITGGEQDAEAGTSKEGFHRRQECNKS